MLIGVGYLFIARRPAQERSLIWLGVLAKGFDVFTLSYRTLVGLTYPVVLVPAAINGAFMIFFLIFLARSATARDGEL